jgi:hypothetical protein
MSPSDRRRIHRTRISAPTTLPSHATTIRTWGEARIPGVRLFRLGPRGSVFGPRRRFGTGSRVPGARYPGPETWQPYRIPIPEGKAGVPAGFPVHASKDAPTGSAWKWGRRDQSPRKAMASTGGRVYNRTSGLKPGSEGRNPDPIVVRNEGLRAELLLPDKVRQVGQWNDGWNDAGYKMQDAG